MERKLRQQTEYGTLKEVIIGRIDENYSLPPKSESAFTYTDHIETLKGDFYDAYEPGEQILIKDALPEDYASVKTMLEQIRSSQEGGQVVSMLTGDFLAPYLLSSIDQGKGMMMAINETPIDYLTWGNHEADIPHKEVCKHVKNYKGTFINSNMQSHETMKYDCSVPYEIIQVQSPDGKQTRKIVLINDGTGFRRDF